MTEHTVAIVGTGPHPDTSGHDGYSMGYRHARSYRAVDDCRLIACADVVSEHARDFGDQFDLSPNHVYEDHLEMLDAQPDIVSICTPPATHERLVTDCAAHDAVRAVHCEKPMAPTFGESERLVEACDDYDVQLTFNLQNRCGDAATEVKTLVDDGVVGTLERIELARHDLLQTGIHHIDLANYVLDDEPVEWILGQIDYPEEKHWYTDMHAEAQSLGMWQYESGVYGLCSTGAAMDAIGPNTNRFIGTDGVIEVSLGSHEVRVRTRDESDWRSVEVGETSPQDAVIQSVVHGLTTGETPIVDGETALGATEIVFGIWESARRRGRVNTPLEIEDNPLEALVESGELP